MAKLLSVYSIHCLNKVAHNPVRQYDFLISPAHKSPHVQYPFLITMRKEEALAVEKISQI